MSSVVFAKLNEAARLPEETAEGSFVYNVFATEDVTIEPGQLVRIRTGVTVTSDRHMLTEGDRERGFNSQLIESDKTTEITPSFINALETPVEIKTGEKIAELKFL